MQLLRKLHQHTQEYYHKRPTVIIFPRFNDDDPDEKEHIRRHISELDMRIHYLEQKMRIPER